MSKAAETPQAVKKKIAFVINSFGKGGAEHVAVNVAEHFWKNGYQILLVTSRKVADWEKSPPESERYGRFGNGRSRTSSSPLLEK